MIRREFLETISSKREWKTKKQYFLQLAENKELLDVGVVGQREDLASTQWLHHSLMQVASTVMGVDINQTGIQYLNEHGYNVKHINDLNNDLFEVITIGDVIEHVDNVREFIEFYANHLKVGGILAITTPNPHSIENLMEIIINKSPSINQEHTNFLDPINLFEQIQRIDGLMINDFGWIYRRNRKGLKHFLFGKILSLLVFSRPYFSASYYIEIKKLNG